MPEKYIGIKFDAINLSRKQLTTKACLKLSLLGKTLMKKKINTEGKAGNLSLKHGKNLIITATNTHMGKLSSNDFTLIRKVDFKKRKVFFSGLKKPSSETLMHALIYKTLKNVKAIIHFHNSKLLKKALKNKLIPKTKKFYPYGTRALAREVVSSIKGKRFLLIRKHGFIVVGNSLMDAKKNLNELIKTIKNA